MKIKLWIDDLRPAPEGWHWAKSNTEAIRILDNPNMEVIEVCIDHDIQHLINPEDLIAESFPCPETFEATARFINLKLLQEGMAPGEGPLPITLITGSNEGAAKLEDALKDAIENGDVKMKRRIGKPYDW